MRLRGSALINLMDETENASLPDKAPTLRVVPMPADANQHGDIFGGWVM